MCIHVFSEFPVFSLSYMLSFTQHFHFFNGWSWFEWSSQQNPNTYIFEVKLHLFLVLKMNWVQKIARGGWSGFGMATVGIDPNTFEVLNGHPNKIPTDKILGGVVQNCPDSRLVSDVARIWRSLTLPRSQEHRTESSNLCESCGGEVKIMK